MEPVGPFLLNLSVVGRVVTQMGLSLQLFSGIALLPRFIDLRLGRPNILGPRWDTKLITDLRSKNDILC